MSLRDSAPLLCLGLVCACTADLGSSDQRPRAPSPTATAEPGAVTNGSDPVRTEDTALPYAAPAPARPGLPARTWLLTPEEYARAVESVVGVAIDVSDMDPTPDTGVYANMSASGIVRLQLAEQYAAKASALVEELGETELLALSSCDQLASSCRSTFLNATIPKAFRRPATAEDLSRYGEIFDLGAASSEASLPFRAVLRAVLTSPFFLYRTEIGSPSQQAASRFKLTSHEVATLLSFSVLGQPPSEALLAAADRDELTDPDRLGPQIAAMLDRPEAQVRFGRFVIEWFKLHRFENEVSKFESVFPGFADVKKDMLEESRSFVAEHGAMTNTLSDLLTAPVPAATGALAAFYAGDTSGTTAPPRIGLLSLGALLAQSAKPYLSSPTLRGLFVRDQLLCQHVTLPENFNPPPIEDTEKLVQPTTTRELYALHARHTACRGCHELLDSVGFLFENFDGAGRPRTLEHYQSPSFAGSPLGPQPIDASGKLVGTDVDGEFASYVELAQALNQSAWVKECVARQAFRYYFGEIESDRGIPPVLEGTRALRESDVLGNLVIGLLSTSSTYERIR